MITDILDVLDRHGYIRSDNAHTARAILLISDLAHIYQGSLDHPFGPYNGEIPSRTEPEPPEPASQDAIVLPANQVSTIVAALNEASLCKRDRAATCADCADQSCGTCQWRLRAAQTYDSLAAWQSGWPRKRRPPGPQPPATPGPPASHSPRQTGRPTSDQPARRQRTQPQAPDYVIVVAASDWLQGRFPAAATSLTHALQADQNRHREPEPDLEAEP